MRATAGHPDCRATCPRYAGGIAVVQAGWLLRLFLPRELSMLSLCVLALAELSVPLLAERTGQTPWHAEHMAKRYGLFTLIVLGESNGVPTMMIRSALLNA